MNGAINLSHVNAGILFGFILQNKLLPKGGRVSAMAAIRRGMFNEPRQMIELKSW